MGKVCSCSCASGLRKLVGRTSFLGEDAFYRDNFPRFRRTSSSDKMFYDAEEGDSSHDSLFEELKEQYRLKAEKTRVLAGAVKATLFHSQTTGSFSSSPTSPRSAWFGTTLRQCAGNGTSERNEGPCWSTTNGENLRVRTGPSYKTKSLKTASQGSLYEAISCDAVKSDVKLENIVGRLLDRLPAAPEGCRWKRGCEVPRIICINLMLPYAGGLSHLRPFGAKPKDAGCSFVGLFQIRPETLAALESQKAPPAVECWRKFCKGPAAAPGASVKDPDRSLGKRLRPGIKKDYQSGLFKAMAYCMNASELKVPDMLHRFNGKPCLITKSGYIVRDPEGEWVEIGIDVRGFCTLALSMLSSFRHLLPEAQIHYGFLVQASDDEELPEEILCDMSVYWIDMMKDPVAISNEADYAPLITR